MLQILSWKTATWLVYSQFMSPFRDIKLILDKANFLIDNLCLCVVRFYNWISSVLFINLNAFFAGKLHIHLSSGYCVSTTSPLQKTKPSGMFQRDIFLLHSCFLRLLAFNFLPTFTTSVIIAAPAVVWTWNLLHTHIKGCDWEIVMLNHQHG